jgi:parvulin-like peptidyl-prolyl isomerase
MAKRVKKPKGPTKKQIARSRREEKQQKWVLIGIGSLVALVVIVLGIGIYNEFVAKPAAPVAVVNGVNIRLDEYQSRVRLERLLTDNYIANLQSQLVQAEMSGGEEEENFMLQYLNNMLQQAYQERAGADLRVVNALIEEELVRQKAKELGIEVTEEEVTQEIRNSVAIQQGFWTSEQATATIQARVERTATARSFTPTPTITATEVITDVNPTPSPTPFTPTPTPTTHIMTGDEFTESYNNFMQTVTESTGMDGEDYRRLVSSNLLIEKLREHFAENTPASAEQVHARHILVETEDEAKEIISRLEAGEDFAELAAELSTDTTSGAMGGDLGWFPRGAMVAAFEDAAFSLEPGEISEPVESGFGWHVIEVLEKEERPLEDYALAQAQENAYQEWLEEAQGGEEVENLWTPDMSPPEE